jgi:eukaryotic-like serine/threonine-protein kinase
VIHKVGRYVLKDELAAGGMGKVHLGILSSKGGFSRLVAIKALHSQYARDPDVRSMFLDEARLVASIRHPNVASTLDVLEEEGELFLVMDYVHGLPLSQIVRDMKNEGAFLPIPIVSAVLVDALWGLHAAHEARAPNGTALNIVHRDVSPQNIMVGNDGLARVLDFGVAHAADRLQQTVPGQIKGKASYMAPEQATGRGVDRRADIYGAGIVLWEALAGARPFTGPSFSAVVLSHLHESPRPPSGLRPEIPPALDAIVLRALEKDPDARFATAQEMADAIERAVGRASRFEVSAWLQSVEAAFFADRNALLERWTAADAGLRISVVPDDDLSRPTVPDPIEDGGAARTMTGTTRPVADTTGSRRNRTPLLLALLAAGVVSVALTLASRPAHPVGSPGVSASAPASPPSGGMTAAVAPSAPADVAPDALPSAAAPATTASSPARPVAHSLRPQASPAPSVRAPATQAPSAPATAQVMCCTADGTLQLHFHDCVDNCRN